LIALNFIRYSDNDILVIISFLSYFTHSFYALSQSFLIIQFYHFFFCGSWNRIFFRFWSVKDNRLMFSLRFLFSWLKYQDPYELDFLINLRSLYKVFSKVLLFKLLKIFSFIFVCLICVSYWFNQRIFIFVMILIVKVCFILFFWILI
jgi:hypothetical protein